MKSIALYCVVGAVLLSLSLDISAEEITLNEPPLLEAGQVRELRGIKTGIKFKQGKYSVKTDDEHTFTLKITKNGKKIIDTRSLKGKNKYSFSSALKFNPNGIPYGVNSKKLQTKKGKAMDLGFKQKKAGDITFTTRLQGSWTKMVSDNANHNKCKLEWRVYFNNKAVVSKVSFRVLCRTQANPEYVLVKKKSFKHPLVDNFNKASVRKFYRTEYDLAPVSIEFTGDAATCKVGSQDPAFRLDSFRRANYYRVLAGLPKVSLDNSLTSGCVQASLMFSRNKQLSHSPPNTWACYTEAGRQSASKSNICYGCYGRGAVDAYMNDYGTHNAPVGHRRWLLYPRLVSIGLGSVGRSGSYIGANAMQVITSFGDRPGGNNAVPWPPAGYVVYRNLPGSGRFSYSRPSCDFTDATVTVKKDGVSIAVAIEHRNGSFGDSTIVFTSQEYPSHIVAPTADVDLDIKITGVKQSGATLPPIKYTVTVISD